jgi:hypothetical protein
MKFDNMRDNLKIPSILKPSCVSRKIKNKTFLDWACIHCIYDASAGRTVTVPVSGT